jgi:hypothetical protein
VILVLLDLHPDTCYKNFKYHISTLQKEGFYIWDADTKCVFTSCPVTLLFTVNSVALVDINGLLDTKELVDVEPIVT